MTPMISDKAARISVGRSAPTIFAANQTGAENTTMNPTCTIRAGSPDMLKFIGRLRCAGRIAQYLADFLFHAAPVAPRRTLSPHQRTRMRKGKGLNGGIGALTPT